MNKNDTVTLEITDMSSSGDGVGKADGLAVFVADTAVGDTVRALILKVKKSYAFAKAIEILNESPDRIESECPYSKLCGGCSFRHISYKAELAYKEKVVKENIKRISGIDMEPEPITGLSDLRYRNKASYPIAQDGTVGFYARNSHRIIPVSDCLLEPEEFSEICGAFKAWVNKYNITVFNEITKKGLLKRLVLRKAFTTNEIMVGVVATGEIPFKTELTECLLKQNKNIKTIVLNINKKDNNVILGDFSRNVFGGGYIKDILCGIEIRISLKSFYQVNHDMAQLLYKKAAQYGETDNKLVLDLYCGTGTIGLSLAKRAKEVIGVEIVPEAVKDAEVNAKSNNLNNISFICSDASSAARELEKRAVKPQTVILDPPRKGCDRALIETVCNGFKPERAVYVSCDSATLARDIKAFEEMGYMLIKYAPFDLFPRTRHVECVALLKRKNEENVS